MFERSVLGVGIMVNGEPDQTELLCIIRIPEISFKQNIIFSNLGANYMLLILWLFFTIS